MAGKGSLVNQSKLNAVTIGYRKLFQDSMKENDGLESIARMFMMDARSTGTEENYNWLGAAPSVEEWIGDRPLSRLRADDYSIKNKDWANGIALKLNDLNDDRLGLMSPIISQLANKFKYFTFKRFLSLVENGDTELCYDGLAFFSASHVSGSSGTQSNVDTSNALSSTTFEAAYAAMTEYVNDRAEVLGIVPTHLWCGTTLRPTAMEIVDAKLVDDGDSNTNRGLVKPLIIPGLADATMWGLVDLSSPYKPFIRQERNPINFTAMDKADSEHVFSHKEVRYGADWRGNFGYGLWQSMYMSTN